MWDAGKTEKYIRERTGKTWCLDVKKKGAEDADDVFLLVCSLDSSNLLLINELIYFWLC